MPALLIQRRCAGQAVEIVKEGSEYREIQNFFQFDGKRLGYLDAFLAAWINQDDLSELRRIKVICLKRAKRGSVAGNHVCDLTDDVFCEIKDQLHIQIIGIGDPWFFRKTETKKIYGIDRMLVGQKFGQGRKTFGRVGRLKSVNQKDRRTFAALVIKDPAVFPIIERSVFRKPAAFFLRDQREDKVHASDKDEKPQYDGDDRIKYFSDFFHIKSLPV